MDPQQRLFLQEAWRTLEDAGYAGAGIQGRRCGVYVGCAGRRLSARSLTRSDADAPAQAFWGNACSIIPARIAYHLDLQGPAIAVGHRLLKLAGCHAPGLPGVVVRRDRTGACRRRVSFNAPRHFIWRQIGPECCRRVGVVTPSMIGRTVLCRVRASVWWCSSGCRKRLPMAITFMASFAVRRSTRTARPMASRRQARWRSNASSARSMTASLSKPEQIQMVEAHGTGTRLGDPIEYRALTNAFRRDTDKRALLRHRLDQDQYRSRGDGGGYCRRDQDIAFLAAQANPAIAELQDGQ